MLMNTAQPADSPSNCLLVLLAWLPILGTHCARYSDGTCQINQRVPQLSTTSCFTSLVDCLLSCGVELLPGLLPGASISPIASQSGTGYSASIKLWCAMLLDENTFAFHDRFRLSIRTVHCLDLPVQFHNRASDTDQV